ncbi:MAG TPA: sigma 54-interacting transcriptional regulator, partial [Thermodesulfovibrionales bacterium]|nr:sigma 54-interacting transcriptional regulator [Thermodesulfovibrionales bacterium]
VFLDEIGDLGHQLQAKLLRVMDDHEIRPLGGIQAKKIDIRFITATNRDITKAVQDGFFREDLYYRINVVTLQLPPLRDRKDDIMILAYHFLEKYSQDIGKPVKYINDAVIRLLVDYRWPGNVRELQNIIERAVLITDSNTIFPEHLPEGLKVPPSFSSGALRSTLSIEAYTKEFILMHQQHCTEQKLAEMLGITRKSLWEKRKKYGIKRQTGQGLNQFQG